jgi:hypothetical protein
VPPGRGRALPAEPASRFLNSTGAHGAHIPPDAQPTNLERYIHQFRVGPNVEAISTLKALLPEERKPLWVGKSLVDY